MSTVEPQRPRAFLSGRTIGIPPDRYTSDLELHDRFLQFSGELMKLALGGIAAIGFLVTTLVGKGGLPPILFARSVEWPTIASVAAFVLAAGAALGHRFLASDGMFHHLRAIKHLVLIEGEQRGTFDQSEIKQIENAARADEKWRNAKFRKSERLLWMSGWLLFVGVFAFGVSLMAVLGHGPNV